MAEKRALIISEQDNVATAVEAVEAGDTVAARFEGQIVLLEAVETVPFGFKIALNDIASGGLIYKYGEVIGKASTAIKKGSMVHIHNIEGTRGRGDLTAGVNP